MIKRMTLLVRKDELSFSQFSNYWRDHHAKIVERMPLVSGYLQNPVIERLTNGAGNNPSFTFDGVVELWFHDEDARIEAFNSPAAKSLPADELNFIRGITIFAVEEKKLKSGGGNTKVMLLCRSGGPIDERVASLPLVRCAVANHVRKVDWRTHLWHEPSPPDLIVELRLDSVSDAQALAGSPEFASLEEEVKSRGGTLAGYLVEERRVI